MSDRVTHGTMMDDNLTPHRRSVRAEILTAATVEARKAGLYNMRRNSVATRTGCANGLVNNYFGTIDALRDEVVREAIRLQQLDIIGQALAARDPLCDGLAADLRQRVAMHMVGA